MLSHYATVSARNLRKTPVSALVNVLTLSLGLVCFISTYAVVRHWTKVDAQFAKADRTYVITSSLEFNDGEIRSGVFARTTEYHAKYLETDFPALETVVRAYGFPDVSASTGERGLRLYRMIVDADFFDIFDLPFVAGDPHEAVRQPRSVVLTQETATRLFGDEDPMGKTVTLANHIDTTVTGIVETIPESSHLSQVDFFTSWDIRRALQLARNPNAPEPRENWFGGYICTTYAVLPADGSLSESEFLRGLEGFTARRVSPEELGSSNFEVSAIPLSQITVTSLNNSLFGGASGYLSVTTLLLGLGGLILVIACVNYANLATARAIARAKDAGLRKVVGATRGQIAGQYLFESGLLVTAAGVVAALLMGLVAPALKAMAEIDIVPTVLSSVEFYLFLVLMLGVVTLVAGAYPALVLSGARPLDALRLGGLRSGPKRLSRVLVGVQFSAASFLLMAVIVMYSQNIDLRKTGLGLTSDPLLVIDNASALTGVESETLRNELSNIPQISGVTEAGSVPWMSGIAVQTIARSPEVSAAGRSVFPNWVGYDFFSVFGMQTLAGRVFDRDHADLPPEWSKRDPDSPFHIVADSGVIEELGFESPEAAVDQIVYYPANPGGGIDVAQPLQIIGVVESQPMHLQGAGSSSNFFFLGQNFENQIARLSAADVPGALAAIDAMWQRISPLMPRSRRFMDDIFNESYATFGKINQSFATLALMALFISMVGLLGMAIQVANRRVHEIGVRKTLGATNGQVVRMLLTDFGKPVIIANVIAWPLAYLAAQAYLNLFMHRIPLTPTPFVVSLILTLLIAGLAVAGQALRAARVRPAEVLSCE